MSSKSLHEAAAAGNIRLVQELLADKSLKINSTISKAGTSYTALHLASMKGHAEVVKLLISKGAQADKLVEKKGKKKTTALHLAAKKGHIDVLKVLLEAGAFALLEDEKGNTPLDFALSDPSQIYLDIIDLLLQKSNVVDYTRYLRRAVYHKNAPGFRLLVSRGAKLNNFDHVEFWRLGIKKGNVELLKLLVEQGVELDTKKKRSCTTALHFACKKGTQEMVEYLLEHLKGFINLRTESRGYTPLHYAAERGLTDIAQLLISKGAEVNISSEKSDKMMPLHLACEKGNCSVAKVLLENGAAVNAFNGKYFTPLHIACRGGFSELVVELLKAGADITIKSGCTAKEMAVADEVVEIIREYEEKLLLNSPDLQTENFVLKERIKELEAEIASLKKNSN